MLFRLAACESCRKAKLACDHKQPACTRCESRAGICIYRSSPFKRNAECSPSGNQSSPRRSAVQSSVRVAPYKPPYPNPGYLGSSSHVTIFNHISPEDYHGPDTTHTSHTRDCPTDTMILMHSQHFGDDNPLIQGAELLKLVLTTFSLSTMKDFVMFWLSTGANLALAEPFTEQCAKDIDILFASFYDEENGYTVYAQRLLQNSRLRLNIDELSNISNFSAQFLGQNFRWETLGFFFCAVCRATIDLPFFPLLYANDSNRIALRRLSTKLIDIALSNVLLLDGLNDLQLILQFESFIVHSHVDGVHSHHSWSRLGDVISSMFALGYHDNIEKTKPRIPHFLTEIRKAAYATVYSADKNVAIFLGRPPRMSKRFTHFQLPLNQTSPGPNPIPYLNGDVIQWNQDTPCSYRAELRWSALCASLKEDILELLRTRNSETYIERASVIQRNAEAQWNALPPHFKLQCNLKACAGTPFERDFLAGTRLNHLHVLFLLRLLFLDTVAEPDVAIIDISEQMLSLVVDTMLLRDQLVNSGTGLVWKVAHYGLPAAGMILLSMLKQQSSQTTGKHFMPKALLDLGIFAAQVQAGSIVRPGDPTYALIYKATQTIEKFLDSMHREAAQPPTEVTSQMEGNDDWAALFDQDVFDFETAFWQNLAGHPLFMVPEDPMSD